ncbi:MAG: hypothetical protein JSV52_06130 [Candidatus Zixiibacteriota bacterium]|nr:MAG: hypothetical protein JSV52_06130 [candidate division Zixibacteria bacterium]
MRRTTVIFLVLAVALFMLPSATLAVNGNFYQWLHDDDGDGIPNCLDPDWYPPEDGSGYKNGNGQTIEATDASDNGSNGDCDRLQLKDGTSGNCPDTCHIP